MIDWNAVNTLRSDIGEEEFEEVIEIFFEEIDAGVAELSEATDLASALHFLRSGALNLGFSELATLCAAGEAKAESGAPQDVDRDQIIACYTASRQAFQDGLADLDAA